MSIAEIIPAPNVQRLVDSFLDEAWRGRRALVQAFGWPERMRGANAPPAGLTYALTRVRRLLRLVRLTFFIVAT